MSLVKKVLAVSLSTLMLVGSAAMPAWADTDPDQLKVMLVLDASGSMQLKDPSGVTRLVAAQQALTSSLQGFPDDAYVGLRVYGATVKVPSPTPESCADTQLVHPVSPLDKSALGDAIMSFDAVGDTPTSYALTQAAKDLGTEGVRRIILVSDGEENCVPDPCPVVREIVESGIGLQIDTVGFAVDEAARKQLQCIAEVGGGSYFDAKDAADLTATLTELSKRDARIFSVMGDPVIGTPTADGAPVLRVGQYTDISESSSTENVSKFYRVERTIAGSTLRVSVVGREVSGTYWNINLSTPDGVKCDGVRSTGGDQFSVPAFMARTVVALPLDPTPGVVRDSDKACAETDELLFEIERTPGAFKGISDSVPVEIRVIEEGAAQNVADLPAGLKGVPGYGDDLGASPADGSTPVSTVGGTSFNDAVELVPGSYVTDLVIGEAVFFKTPIDWGQSATFAIDGPEPTFPLGKYLWGAETLNLRGDVYAPDFSRMNADLNSMGMGWQERDGKVVPWIADRAALIQVVPEVRFRNRWDSPRMDGDSSRGFSMAGYYYFGIVMDDRREKLDRVPVPIRFSFAVDGEPYGVPEFETVPLIDPVEPPVATEEPVSQSDAPPITEEPVSTVPEESTGIGFGTLFGGALIAAGVLGGIGYAVMRTRARATR